MEYEQQLAKLAKKGYKPGDKINRTYHFSHYVASIGYAFDWAVYVGSYDTDDIDVAEYGEKISAKDARRIFPEIACLRLYYRL